MGAHTDNRAVTALFRVFGGAGERCHAEACQHTDFRGMHAGECLALAVWIPLSVLVATGDWLCGWLGLHGWNSVSRSARIPVAQFAALRIGREERGHAMADVAGAWRIVGGVPS